MSFNYLSRKSRPLDISYILWHKSCQSSRKNPAWPLLKQDISSAWNLSEWKLINTPAKYRPLGGVTCKHDWPLGQAHILFEQHKIYIFISTSHEHSNLMVIAFQWLKIWAKIFIMSYRTHIDMEIWLVSPRGRRGHVTGTTAATTWRFGCKNKIVFKIVLSNLSIQNRSSSPIWAFNKQN